MIICSLRLDVDDVQYNTTIETRRCGADLRGRNGWIFGTVVGRKVEIIADYRSTPCDQGGTSEQDGQLIYPGFEIVVIAEV